MVLFAQVAQLDVSNVPKICFATIVLTIIMPTMEIVTQSALQELLEIKPEEIGTVYPAIHHAKLASITLHIAPAVSTDSDTYKLQLFNSHVSSNVWMALMSIKTESVKSVTSVALPVLVQLPTVSHALLTKSYIREDVGPSVLPSTMLLRDSTLPVLTIVLTDTSNVPLQSASLVLLNAQLAVVQKSIVLPVFKDLSLLMVLVQ